MSWAEYLESLSPYSNDLVWDKADAHLHEWLKYMEYKKDLEKEKTQTSEIFTNNGELGLTAPPSFYIYASLPSLY